MYYLQVAQIAYRNHLRTKCFQAIFISTSGHIISAGVLDTG